MVGTVDSVTVPELMFRLLNVIAPEPFTVPAPVKLTVPEPRVKVALFVSVPEAAMVRVPAPDQLKVPLFVTVETVNEPLAPNVRALDAFIVIKFGAFETALLTVTE